MTDAASAETGAIEAKLEAKLRELSQSVVGLLPQQAADKIKVELSQWVGAEFPPPAISVEFRGEDNPPERLALGEVTYRVVYPARLFRDGEPE